MFFILMSCKCIMMIQCAITLCGLLLKYCSKIMCQFISTPCNYCLTSFSFTFLVGIHFCKDYHVCAHLDAHIVFIFQIHLHYEKSCLLKPNYLINCHVRKSISYVIIASELKMGLLHNNLYTSYIHL